MPRSGLKVPGGGGGGESDFSVQLRPKLNNKSLHKAIAEGREVSPNTRN